MSTHVSNNIDPCQQDINKGSGIDQFWCCPGCGFSFRMQSLTEALRENYPEAFEPIPGEDEFIPEIVFAIRGGVFDNRVWALNPTVEQNKKWARQMAKENGREREFDELYLKRLGSE